MFITVRIINTQADKIFSMCEVWNNLARTNPKLNCIFSEQKMLVLWRFLNQTKIRMKLLFVVTLIEKIQQIKQHRAGGVTQNRFLELFQHY